VSSYLKNILVMFRGTSLAQIIPLIGMLALVRIYDVEHIGGYAIYLAVANIIGTTAGARLETAIVPATITDRPILVDAVKLLFLPLSLIAITALWGIVSITATTIISVDWTTAVFLLSMSGAILFNNTHYYLNASYNRFHENSNSRVIISVLTVTLQILLPQFFTSSEKLLLLSRLIALVLGASYLKIFSYSNLSLWVGFNSVWGVIKKYKKYVLYYWPSSFLDVLAMNIPVIVIGTLFGQSFSGYYSVAQKSVSIPSATASNAISHVFFKNFSDQIKEGVLIPSVLLKTWLTLALIGIIPFSIATIYGEFIAVTLFGQEWLVTGTIIRIISPMALLMFISSSTSTALLTLNAQRLILIFSLSQIVYRIGSIYYGFMIDDLIVGILVMVVFHSAQIIFYDASILHLLRRRKR